VRPVRRQIQQLWSGWVSPKLGGSRTSHSPRLDICSPKPTVGFASAVLNSDHPTLFKIQGAAFPLRPFASGSV
jgi:hypothetical protein